MSKKQVLIATQKPFDPEARDAMIDVLQQGGLGVKVLEGYPKGQLPAALDGVSFLIVRSDKVDSGVIDAAQHLELVVRAGTGHDNVDSKYAEQRGILVENTPGQNANAVAELTIGYMGAYARNLHAAYQAAREGSPLPKEMMGFELTGKKVGLHGFGNIGRRVAEILNAYGAKVIVNDVRPISKEDMAKYLITSGTPQEVYQDARVVSLHFTGGPENTGVANYGLLSRMSERALLINTVRPSVVDHADLARIMDERPGFGYAIDVEAEKFPAELKRHMARVLWTNKWGAQTPEANENAGMAAARQVVNYHVTGRPTYPVNSPNREAAFR